jgi:hypothetical protein
VLFDTEVWSVLALSERCLEKEDGFCRKRLEPRGRSITSQIVAAKKQVRGWNRAKLVGHLAHGVLNMG